MPTLVFKLMQQSIVIEMCVCVCVCKIQENHIFIFMFLCARTAKQDSFIGTELGHDRDAYMEPLRELQAPLHLARHGPMYSRSGEELAAILLKREVDGTVACADRVVCIALRTLVKRGGMDKLIVTGLHTQLGNTYMFITVFPDA